MKWNFLRTLFGGVDVTNVGLVDDIRLEFMVQQLIFRALSTADRRAVSKVTCSMKTSAAMPCWLIMLLWLYSFAFQTFVQHQQRNHQVARRCFVNPEMRSRLFGGVRKRTDIRAI